ncbi:spidroin-1-like [Sorghum bicolor]|uniref:spidroin-1-like n=1 Tax=Sorghum bicolor TaxID=4558 RepID=UPI000B42479C|nr:spidroin-1-like [Sorghum bicolor]|eukprot:XP_021321416.1 spidroin-1-like [Sorghum bicolor]
MSTGFRGVSTLQIARKVAVACCCCCTFWLSGGRECSRSPQQRRGCHAAARVVTAASTRPRARATSCTEFGAERRRGQHGVVDEELAMQGLDAWRAADGSGAASWMELGGEGAASLLDVATVASTRPAGVVAAAGARARPTQRGRHGLATGSVRGVAAAGDVVGHRCRSGQARSRTRARGRPWSRVRARPRLDGAAPVSWLRAARQGNSGARPMASGRRWRAASLGEETAAAGMGSRRKEALLTAFIGAAPRVLGWPSILGVRAVGGPRGANRGARRPGACVSRRRRLGLGAGALGLGHRGRGSAGPRWPAGSRARVGPGQVVGPRVGGRGGRWARRGDRGSEAGRGAASLGRGEAGEGSGPRGIQLGRGGEAESWLGWRKESRPAGPGEGVGGRGKV